MVATADGLVDEGRSEIQHLLRTIVLTSLAMRSKAQITNDGQIQYPNSSCMRPKTTNVSVPLS